MATPDVSPPDAIDVTLTPSGSDPNTNAPFPRGVDPTKCRLTLLLDQLDAEADTFSVEPRGNPRTPHARGDTVYQFTLRWYGSEEQIHEYRAPLLQKSRAGESITSVVTTPHSTESLEVDPLSTETRATQATPEGVNCEFVIDVRAPLELPSPETVEKMGRLFPEWS